MKTRSLIFLLLIVGLWPAMGQDLFAPMKVAIKNGNEDQLSTHFNQNLDVNLEGNLSTFSKTQAAFAIGEFFNIHPPTDFTIVHKGSSQAGLQFAIGKYVSNKESFTVLIRVKETGEGMLIHEISFVKEKK